MVCPPNPEGTVKIEIPLENNIVYSSPIQFYYADEQVIPICGNISGNWEAGATYLITCNVTIDYIDTLIIEEGVKILAMPEENVRLICNGILEVNGTQDNPVLFTSANKVQGSWNGISIYGIYDSCKFNYCIVEYASTAISLYARAWGCFLQRNYSEFKNCIIRNNSKNAFYCVGEGDYEFGCSNPKTGACSPLIQNCQIYNNGLNGIELVAYDGYKSKGYIGAKVYNNLIYNNRNGIYCHGDDNVEPKIINNVITKNSVSGINSIHQNFTVENYQIANNIISNNGIGIINEDTTAIILNNNNLWSNALDFQGMFQDELNIFENSLFIDFQNNDFNLQSSSPCINSGSNDFVDFETDFSGKIRIFDGLGNGITKVDIGAFEYGAPCSQIEIERTICSGDSIQIGDSIFSQTGNYTVTFSNIHGCDSIVNLDLTVQTVDASVSQSGFTLTAHASDADYKWLNCADEYSNIVGETNQSYTATKSGSYAVEITQGNCADTSDCFEITIVDIF